MRKIFLSVLVFTCLGEKNIIAQYWSPLGAGIENNYDLGSVNSIIKYNGNLYAGGYFNLAGGIEVNNIARWDGTNWHAVGTGLYGSVSTLVIFNNELYAGGWFQIAGDTTNNINNVARWDGANWSAVGTQGFNDAVYCLTVFDNELYAGGWFTAAGDSIVKGIAKWNGANWSRVGNGLNGGVYSMTVNNDELYAAGSFWEETNPLVYNIARWTGTKWSPVGNGLNGSIYCMAFYNDELYVGGINLSTGGAILNNIAKWNGANWSVVGVGNEFINDEVHSLAVYDSALFAGSGVQWYIGGAIAKWDGSEWTDLEQRTDGTINTLTADDSTLYAGGTFSYINNYQIWAGKIAMWIGYCNASPSQPDNITGNTTVCPNSSQTYIVNHILGAGNYIWTLPTGWIGSSNKNSISVVTGTTGGNISVIAENNCGRSIPQQIEVTMKPIPQQPDSIFGNLYAITGQSDSYSVSPVIDATNYIWSLNGGGDIGSGKGTNSIIIDWWYPGTHTISVSVSNNCGPGALQNKTIKVVDAGGKDPYEIKLLPNPSAGEFFLKAKRVQDKVIRVDVMNMMGQAVYHSRQMTGTNDYTQQINLLKMPQGVYVVKISVDNEVYVRRIMKNR